VKQNEEDKLFLTEENPALADLFKKKETAVQNFFYNRYF
jgi:hypothetical protein